MRGRRSTSFLSWALLVLAALALVVARPSVAFAKTELVVTDLSVPEDRQSKEFEKLVRTIIQRAAKPLDFGHSKRVEITVRLTEFKIESDEDLVRVTCTLVVRLKGGGTARSHISFGDKPKRKKGLEKQVLKMATESVLIRIAEMNRVREALEKKKKEAGEASDSKASDDASSG
jgi:hypothetical protein